jgi:hypothetical protein
MSILSMVVFLLDLTPQVYDIILTIQDELGQTPLQQIRTAS